MNAMIEHSPMRNGRARFALGVAVSIAGATLVLIEIARYIAVWL